MRFSELFATASRVQLNPGDERCFWCGTPCDQSYGVRVTKTFWDWDAVAFPRSEWQCAGCTEFLREKREMSGYEKPQKTRNHSWYASDKPELRSFTKRDLPALREICLDPPADFAWGLAIAVSGQKHILYRTPVNLPGGESFKVQLEQLTVGYHPDDLWIDLALCARLARVVGKPPLGGPLNVSHAITLGKAGEDPALVDHWNPCWNRPEMRLAAFLSPSKGDADAWLEDADP